MSSILDLLTITNISAVVMIVGSLGIIALPKPLDKVIMLSIAQAGFVAAIVAAQYLDVAMAAAIFDPISTVIFLIALIKLDEIRKNKEKVKKENIMGEKILA